STMHSRLGAWFAIALSSSRFRSSSATRARSSASSRSCSVFTTEERAREGVEERNRAENDQAGDRIDEREQRPDAVRRDARQVAARDPADLALVGVGPKQAPRAVEPKREEEHGHDDHRD